VNGQGAFIEFVVFLIRHPALRANVAIALAHRALEMVFGLMASLTDGSAAVNRVGPDATWAYIIFAVNVQRAAKASLVFLCGHPAFGTALVVSLADLLLHGVVACHLRFPRDDLLLRTGSSLSSVAPPNMAKLGMNTARDRIALRHIKVSVALSLSLALPPALGVRR
jgi:hypothetical protein